MSCYTLYNSYIVVYIRVYIYIFFEIHLHKGMLPLPVTVGSETLIGIPHYTYNYISDIGVFFAVPNLIYASYMYIHILYP